MSNPQTTIFLLILLFAVPARADVLFTKTEAGTIQVVPKLTPHECVIAKAEALRPKIEGDKAFAKRADEWLKQHPCKDKKDEGENYMLCSSYSETGYGPSSTEIKEAECLK